MSSPNTNQIYVTIFVNFVEVSYMNQFGKIIKTYLIEHDIKQQYIVDKLGVSKNAVSQLLNRDNISLDKMLMIAEALDCDLKIELIPKEQENK